jgi:hypothetical protein
MADDSGWLVGIGQDKCEELLMAPTFWQKME